MRELFIIAAGKGSRLGGNIPKALVPISGVPNLTLTLQKIGRKFDHVFVVTNSMMCDEWDAYQLETMKNFPELINTDTTHFITIGSGLGDGHAVLRALQERDSYRERGDDITICWGDTFFQNANIVDELLSKKFQNGASGIVPCVREENPYVTLLVDDRMRCISADFSKYGENHPSGFHDQSIFRFKRTYLLTALQALHASFWKNGRYITPGGELSLLHTFHFLYNRDNPVVVYETDYPTNSFNTTEELNLIRQQLGE